MARGDVEAGLNPEGHFGSWQWFRCGWLVRLLSIWELSSELNSLGNADVRFSSRSGAGCCRPERGCSSLRLTKDGSDYLNVSLGCSARLRMVLELRSLKIVRVFGLPGNLGSTSFLHLSYTLKVYALEFLSLLTLEIRPALCSIFAF